MPPDRQPVICASCGWTIKRFPGNPVWCPNCGSLAARRQRLTGVMSMNTDPRCPRCGTALKIERVKVLVERHAEDAPVTFHHYEERDEVADCPRCTGSY